MTDQTKTTADQILSGGMLRIYTGQMPDDPNDSVDSATMIGTTDFEEALKLSAKRALESRDATGTWWKLWLGRLRNEK